MRSGITRDRQPRLARRSSPLPSPIAATFSEAGGASGKPNSAARSSKRTHRVGAGQNQPIVGIESAQRQIDGVVARGRLNLKHRNFDRLGAQRAQAIAQLARLVRSARDEDALTRKHATA